MPLDKEQKIFIEVMVKSLQNEKAVKEFYHKQDAVCKYAKEYAECIYRQSKKKKEKI